MKQRRIERRKGGLRGVILRERETERHTERDRQTDIEMERVSDGERKRGRSHKEIQDSHKHRY